LTGLASLEEPPLVFFAGAGSGFAGVLELLLAGPALPDAFPDAFLLLPLGILCFL
jgi:hypothetical protein